VISSALENAWLKRTFHDSIPINSNLRGAKCTERTERFKEILMCYEE
jgi:hypothetical protein